MIWIAIFLVWFATALILVAIYSTLREILRILNDEEDNP